MKNRKIIKILIIVIIILFIILPTILYPISMVLSVVGIIFQWLKLRKSNNHFWLSETEKQEYHNTSIEIVKIDTKISNLIATAKDKKISKNVDGSYSNRSDFGKDLNVQLKELKPLKLNKFKLMKRLEYKPFQKWTNVNNTFSEFYASILSFIISIVTFLIITKDFGDLISLFTDFPFSRFSESVILGLHLSGLAYILTFFGIQFLFKKLIFNIFHKKPQLVTINNFDKY